MTTRRQFLRRLATASSAVVLMPAISRCGGASSVPDGMDDLASIPLVQPPDWDPVAYNRARGNAGAIPDSYLDDINGPDGEEMHLGKHLPYLPALDATMVPAGMVPLMWGDPDKGHARHPNAVRSEANDFEGHWYNWIRIRKAVAGPAEELESTYTDWPGTNPGDDGAYAVFGDGDITADGDKNTIYLAAVPSDVQPGDWVRIHAHCLTHGEYVDFMRI